MLEGRRNVVLPFLGFGALSILAVSLRPYTTTFFHSLPVDEDFRYGMCLVTVSLHIRT
jgi:hypothetical protein